MTRKTSKKTAHSTRVVGIRDCEIDFDERINDRAVMLGEQLSHSREQFTNLMRSKSALSESIDPDVDFYITKLVPQSIASKKSRRVHVLT